jgi:hypothetical protein
MALKVIMETLDLLKTLAPWIAIVVSIIAIIVSIIALLAQLKRSRFSQSVDLILKLEERFSDSKAMKEKRQLAGEALRSNPSSPSSDIEDVLDFFETLGLLVRRKALDEEMVWNTFYHWLHRYWLLCEPYITEKRRTKLTLWGDYVNLEKRIVAIEWEKTKSRDDIDLSKQELDEFINDECNLAEDGAAITCSKRDLS